MASSSSSAAERRPLIPRRPSSQRRSRPQQSRDPSAALRVAFATSNTAASPPQGSPPASCPPAAMVYSSISNPLSDLPVYASIHRIRRDIMSVVEDYISAEQLRDVRINMAVVRPLVDKLYDFDDISIVYCLLVNRAQFLLEEAAHANRHNVHFARATLCELVAARILRRFSDRDDGADSAGGLLLLAHVLVAGFEPFQNAPAEVLRARGAAGAGSSSSSSSSPSPSPSPPSSSFCWFGGIGRRALPALELAILTESKHFLSSTPCQRVIQAIYEGRIVYTPGSFLELIPDHYKRKPIQLYDPRAAPLLNHYRLLVPRTRNALEICHFGLLLVLYLLLMTESDPGRLSWLEILFSVYSFGWALDQFSTIMSHGWHVYTQNLWSFLDVGFTVIYFAYLALRVRGWWTGAPEPGQQAFDVLALGALVLVPRLAFNLLSGNLVFLSLRSMMADFSLLTALSAWCFFGFLLSLYWLGAGSHAPVTISKWMLWIWFGLDGTGIQRSPDFHWLLGPAVMIAFTFLGNTLFLTILVSMLSNTFSAIAANATAEMSYRRAVLTLEGLKSDALFAYMPPFNIVAVFIFFPLRVILSPRWFHKIHVAAVRFINMPLLLAIALAERQMLWQGVHGSSNSGGGGGGGSGGGRSGCGGVDGSSDTLPSPSPPIVRKAPVGPGRHGGGGGEAWWWWVWPEWSSHRDIRAVFDLPPPEEMRGEITIDDEFTRHLVRRQLVRMNTGELPAAAAARRNSSRSTAAPHDQQEQHDYQQQGHRGQEPQPEQYLEQPQPQPQTQQHKSSAGSVPPSGNGNGSHGGGGKTPKSRRDSIFPGIRGSFSEHDDAHASSERLAGLESSVRRIEAMLARLMPDDQKEEDELDETSSLEGLGEHGVYDSGTAMAEPEEQEGSGRDDDA